MRWFQRSVAWSATAAMFLPLFAHDAEAYLDPGTGSYILQVLVGFLLGAAFMARMFWRSTFLRLSGLISRIWRRRDAKK